MEVLTFRSSYNINQSIDISIHIAFHHNEWASPFFLRLKASGFKFDQTTYYLSDPFTVTTRNLSIYNHELSISSVGPRSSLRVVSLAES